MKKNGWKVTFFKYLSLISLGFLSIVTCAIGTYSWFSANGLVEGDGMGMLIKNEEIIDEVTFHQYDSSMPLSDNLCYFDINPSDDHSLGFYSLTGKHHQSLIEVTLKKEFNVDVASITSATFYLGNVYEQDGVTYNQLQLENNSLTSIVDFYVFDPSLVNVTSTNISLDMNNSSSGKQSFINSNYTDLIDSSRLKIASLTSVDKLYILIDYDVISIETIYSSNLGNDVLYQESTKKDEDGNSCISFDIDFFFEIVAVL